MRRWARQRDSAVVERDTPPDAPHVVSRSDSIDPHLEDEVRRRRQPVDRARALVRLEPRALEPLAEERAAHRRVRDVVHAARLRRPRTYHTVYTERSTGMWRRTHTHARAGPANATRRRARLQRRELGRHALRRIARRLLFLLLHRERDPVVRGQVECPPQASTIEHGMAMRLHHALGAPGRSGGIDKLPDSVGVDRHLGRCFGEPVE